VWLLILIPDAQGNLILVTDASPEGETFDLSTDERAVAVAALNIQSLFDFQTVAWL
jgi:hypothetical protein